MQSQSPANKVGFCIIYYKMLRKESSHIRMVAVIIGELD